MPPVSFQGRVDIITCNPPYIPLSQRPILDLSVSKYDPPEALFAPSKYGDDYYYTILGIANRWETPAVVMEVGGLAQAQRVKSLFEYDQQWKSSIWFDSSGRGRVVVAIKSEKWAVLLPQPDYSTPFDLSPFPWHVKTPRGLPGTLLSTFQRRRRLAKPKVLSQQIKRDKEKMVDESILNGPFEELNHSVEEKDQEIYHSYLEDL